MGEQMREPDSRMRATALPQRCSRTGLAVPECSCAQCIEDQVRHYRPELLGTVSWPPAQPLLSVRDR
jgi:hypothetical protein